jgi:hypothetical protein
MVLGTIDDELPHLSHIELGHWFRVSELLGEYWRNSNLIGLNVDVGGDDGSSGIVDSFTLLP